MNNYKWSARYNAFFPVSLLSSYEANWQDITDLIDIDDAVESEFNGEPPLGKTRIVGSDGLPAWGDIPAPTQEELTAVAEQQKTYLRSIADSEIAWRQDAVDTGMATDAETTALAEWKTYRVLLMRVDTSTVPYINWPQPPASN